MYKPLCPFFGPAAHLVTLGLGLEPRRDRGMDVLGRRPKLACSGVVPESWKTMAPLFGISCAELFAHRRSHTPPVCRQFNEEDPSRNRTPQPNLAGLRGSELSLRAVLENVQTVCAPQRPTTLGATLPWVQRLCKFKCTHTA